MPYADPEKRREQQQRRRDANRERFNEQQRQRTPEARHQEYQRRRARTDPEEAREMSTTQSRRWREANPEKAREYGREHQRRRRAADPQGNREYWNAWREANRATWLASRARTRHGADFDADEMRSLQSGCCYLCGDPLSEDGRNANVDHDHSCCPRGKSCWLCRRGLACTRRNTLIGQVNDDPDLLRRIAANLEPVLVAVRKRLAKAAS